MNKNQSTTPLPSYTSPCSFLIFFFAGKICRKGVGFPSISYQFQLIVEKDIIKATLKITICYSLKITKF